MAGRRISARRLAMSRAAKRILKEKKRKEKRGSAKKAEQEPEVRGIGLWVLVIAALIVLGFLVVQIAASGGFG